MSLRLPPIDENIRSLFDVETLSSNDWAPFRHSLGSALRAFTSDRSLCSVCAISKMDGGNIALVRFHRSVDRGSDILWDFGKPIEWTDINEPWEMDK